jgi:hypothetical protein
VSNNLESDALDMMLAQPALIADQGFSERVRGKLGKTISMRSKVFVAAVIGWLALTLSLGSPQAIYEDLNKLVRLFNFSEQVNFVSTQIGSLGYSTLQSIDYTSPQSSVISLIVFALSIAAVSSMLLRN